MTTAHEPADPALRPATGDDVDAIAALWHRGWPDGHRGHVPEALAAHRSLADFQRLVPSRIAGTTVAVLASRVVGFVTVHDDEVEQVYVEAEARGGGVAALLLRHAERQIASRFDEAWLAVVAGNARARRFYERSGWRDGGGFEYAAEIEGGRLAVPCRRYVKPLTPRAGASLAGC